jgi:outer membrane protein assembly factor BamB
MKFGRFILIILGCLILISQSSASDWPRWRGPNGNGITNDTQWNPKSIQNGPNILWEADLGYGYSSPSVKGNYLSILGNKENGNGIQEDIVYCFNAVTGKEIWRHTYACDQGGWPGPRATPTIEGNRLYTLSRSGHLFCFEFETGKILWKRNLIKENMAVDPDCGISGSPVIFGDLLILNAGKTGTAVNKHTGEIVWNNGIGKCGFASPVLYQNAGDTKIALLSRTDLYSLDPYTGEILWSMPWVTRYEENSPDPVHVDKNLFISTGYGKGCVLLDVQKGKPDIVWQNTNMSNHFHTSVFLNGFLYGIDGVMGKSCTLKCLDMKSGDIRWEQPFSFGSISAAYNKLIVLTERGALHIVEASPNGYQEIARTQVMKMPDDSTAPRPKKCKFWSPPVLANGKLYLRSTWGNLICLDIS